MYLRGGIFFTKKTITTAHFASLRIPNIRKLFVTYKTLISLAVVVYMYLTFFNYCELTTHLELYYKNDKHMTVAKETVLPAFGVGSWKCIQRLNP